MCAIDDCDERVEILREKDRVGRKEHRCSECWRTIAIGDTYHYEFGTLEGEAVTYRTCTHCMVARQWLSKNCGGWIYQGVIQEILDHADEYPDLAVPLREIVSGANAKWMAIGGRLMPVPDMPPAISVQERH